MAARIDPRNNTKQEHEIILNSLSKPGAECSSRLVLFRVALFRVSSWTVFSLSTEESTKQHEIVELKSDLPRPLERDQRISTALVGHDKNDTPMTDLSSIRRSAILLVCVAAIFCFAQAAIAQSGRRKTPPPAATPSPVPTQKETSTSPDAAATPESSKPRVKITSIIVSAQTIIPDGFYHSNDVGNFVKDCVQRLKERPVLEVVKGGMRNRKEAVDRAKLEKSAYVLWVELNMEDNFMSSPSVAFIDYFLYLPQTAEIVTKGRVDPTKLLRINESGTQLPRNINKVPASADAKLRVGAREVADRARIWF
jgi:hypothetical protein